MPKSVTHYAGEIVHANGHVLPGWAACCYGEKAEKIRRERRHILDREKVTCRGCLKMIEKADAWVAWREMRQPNVVTTNFAGRFGPGLAASRAKQNR